MIISPTYVAGAWSSNTVFSLGRLLLCKAFSQVTSNETLCVSDRQQRNLYCRLMTVLKRNKNKQWEKAQKRINVSPLASRVSGYESKVSLCSGFTFQLSKVGASRKGCSSGSGFWGESLPQEAADACLGDYLQLLIGFS